MMTNPVLISVIIPTFNRKESLRQALHALANQSLSTDHFEVIVVDDGSTEPIGDFAGRSYPLKFVLCARRIRVMRLPVT
jgi:GT2 family glycosyltransferase